MFRSSRLKKTGNNPKESLKNYVGLQCPQCSSTVYNTPNSMRFDMYMYMYMCVHVAMAMALALGAFSFCLRHLGNKTSVLCS